MNWVCQRGSCLLIPSGRGDKSHVFAVAIGPKALPGYGPKDQVVMVAITTVYEGVPYDPACVLQPGDHAFIQHDSYIYYREPRIETVAHVQQMVSSGSWQPKEPCSDELLDRIELGFAVSKRIPRHIRDLLNK